MNEGFSTDRFLSYDFYTKDIYTIEVFFLQGWKRLRRNRLLEKGGAVAAMLLCVSISFIPCVISGLGRAATLGECVEVRVEACGVLGFAPQVVSLTKQQYQSVESYLLELYERLNRTENREEMRLLLREAVRELDLYGLLPGGMSVRQAERLVAGSYQDSLIRSEREIDRYVRLDQRKKEKFNDNPLNAFCVLFAVARKIEGYIPAPVIVPFGMLLVLGLIPAFFASLFGQQELANRLAELGLSIWMSNPFRWFNIVFCEGYETEVRSIGLKGLVHVTLPERGLFSGFTGLMIAPFKERTFFLGGAFGVYDLS